MQAFRLREMINTVAPLFHDQSRIEGVSGKTVFDYADSLNVRVPTSCGRNGSCHECIVEIKRGMTGLSRPEETESFLGEGYRLACQAVIENPDEDIEFAVLRRQPRILTDSQKRNIDVDPMTRRMGDKVYFGDLEIDGYKGAVFGLAIDAGTTTVAMNLVDLESGKTVYTTSFENPQRFGGSDVMNRISYDAGSYHGELQQVMLSSINFEIGDMARVIGFHRRRIYEIIIVGNATMRDIIFGLDVQPIGEKPYKSTSELAMIRGDIETTALNVKAKDLGLRVFPDANVYGAPLIASHVGSDVAADLLSIGMDNEDEVVMLVDVGTNTEVVVGNKNKLVAASCPAGPAFEGGEVTHGMAGYDGAVESVILDGNEVICHTISDEPAVGICGSGLVDLLSELRRAGKMTELGVLEDSQSEFFFVRDGDVYAQPMSLSRSDISALAQAKSANYSGQYIVMRTFGVKPSEISRLYLAGGFANYINVDSAMNIGFLANVPPERVVKVGNASLEGATIALLSSRLRSEMETMVRRVEHVELESTPDFFDIFVDGCMFNPMQR